MSTPLRAVFRRGEDEYTLTSVRQLAEVLMDPHWPVLGQAYLKACETLVGFLDGRDDISVQDVCDAFAEAIEEAEHPADPIELDCDPLN